MNSMLNRFLWKYKSFPITISLICLCILVYAMSFVWFGEEMNALEGLYFGGFNPVYIQLSHEYYRLLSANFIHFGILHLAVKCYSLYGLGLFIEKSLGLKKYLILILVSALTTTGLPYLFYLITGYGANVVSGGISGVIFGLIGALGALALRYKYIYMDIFKQLAPNIILMLIISFIIPSISLSGHLAGLIGGFVCTYILLMIKHQKHLIH